MGPVAAATDDAAARIATVLRSLLTRNTAGLLSRWINRTPRSLAALSSALHHQRDARSVAFTTERARQGAPPRLARAPSDGSERDPSIAEAPGARPLR